MDVGSPAKQSPKPVAFKRGTRAAGRRSMLAVASPVRSVQAILDARRLARKAKGVEIVDDSDA